MLIFNRKKTIKIRAVVGPHQCYVHAYAPLTLASNLQGYGELSKEGIIIPMWSDIAFRWNNEQIRWQFSDRNSELGVHGADQSPGFLSNYYHIKITSPWMIESPVPIMVMPASSYLNKPSPYVVPPGVLPPLGNKMASNMFIFFEKNNKENTFMIKHGTPMVQLIPLYDGPFEFTQEIVSEVEYSIAARCVGSQTAFNKRGLQLLHKDKKNKK